MIGKGALEEKAPAINELICDKYRGDVFVKSRVFLSEVLFIYYKTLICLKKPKTCLNSSCRVQRKCVEDISLLVVHVQGHVKGRK